MAAMSETTQKAIARKSAITLGVLASVEVIMMISPFAAYFYSFFRPFLNMFSQWKATAWLDGFFLNHALISTSQVLEWQREIGRYLFAAGIWGFLISFVEVYGRKIFRKGVARFGLYAVVRHPQYLSLAVAGWGLLTIWPRFFLLLLYVTMLFVYFLLAAHEERRMAALHPETYPEYAKGKGSFLPGSPGDWLYQRTFAKFSQKSVGFVFSYASVLVLAAVLGFLVRGHVQSSAEMVVRPAESVYGFSCWPQGEESLAQLVDRVLADESVRSKMKESDGKIFFLHALPADYGMKGMFYQEEGSRHSLRIPVIAAAFLLPRPQINRGSHLMGHPTAQFEVVVSKVYQPWRNDSAFDDALQPGTKMVPIAVASLDASKAEEQSEVSTPLAENRWGNLTMPIF